MSDTPEVKRGLVARIKLWIRGRIVDDVPPDLTSCEFECRKLECSQGEWETCKFRLVGMKAGGTGRIKYELHK